MPKKNKTSHNRSNRNGRKHILKVVAERNFPVTELLLLLFVTIILSKLIFSDWDGFLEGFLSAF